MRVEKVLTWLGAWGALRFGGALVVALVSSVLFFELLTPSLARLLPGVAPNRLHFFVASIGLLLGLIGHFVADFWDRVVFAHWYGPRGIWLHLKMQQITPGKEMVFRRDQPVAGKNGGTQGHGHSFAKLDPRDDPLRTSTIVSG